MPPAIDPLGALLPISDSRCCVRFFLEAGDLPVDVELEDAHLRRVVRRDRLRRDRDVGAASMCESIRSQKSMR